jgi:ribonuclease HI
LAEGAWAALEKEHGAAAVEEVRRAIRALAAGPKKLRLFSDGGSHGNPGPSGAGGVIQDASGREVGRYSVFLGVTTNNRAEYRALVEGLDQAERLGGEEVEVLLDSELLVKQLQGLYRVKSPEILPLYGEARERIGRFRKCHFRHIPRGENVEADRLAQQAIALGAKGRADP